LLAYAKAELKVYGKGEPNYSLSFRIIYKNGVEEKFIDTTWHYVNEERVNAIHTLMEELKN